MGVPLLSLQYVGISEKCTNVIHYVIFFCGILLLAIYEIIIQSRIQINYNTVAALQKKVAVTAAGKSSTKEPVLIRCLIYALSCLSLQMMA